MEFLPNEGQWDDFVQYRANLSSGVFWMEEAGWTAWIAGEGYDELWAHEDLNGDGMPELLIACLERWNLLEVIKGL